MSLRFLSWIRLYDIFLFKFFYELTCGGFYPVTIDVLDCSGAGLQSLKNGDPKLTFEVTSAEAEKSVLPEAYSCWVVESGFTNDYPGVFSFLYLLFFNLISLKFFSFYTNLS